MYAFFFQNIRICAGKKAALFKMIHFLRRKRSGKIKQIPAGSRKVNRENLENAENKKSKAKIFNFKNDAF